MFVLCAAISECNNKQHSPLHVELPLEKWLEIAAAVILTGAIVSCSQKRVFVQQQTIAPITIRTSTRPSGAGRLLNCAFVPIATRVDRNTQFKSRLRAMALGPLKDQAWKMYSECTLRFNLI